MSSQAILPRINNESPMGLEKPQIRIRKSAPRPVRFPAYTPEGESSAHRQAELFYLQKQVQWQTPVVLVLEDGEQIEGCIEWYDRYSLKVRGRAKSLIYKSAIKYMYKAGEGGQ